MIVNRAERHYIKKAHKDFKVIDDLCFKSKNVYNYANYLIRQQFVENGKIIKRFDMQKIMKDTDCYKSLGSNVGQVTIQMLDRNWKSFFTAIKDWSENPSKYYARPKIPRYLNKNGRYVVGLTNNRFKIVDGYIRFSWKKLYCMNNTFKTRIPNSAKLMQVRFVPKGNYYVMEICYQIEVPDSLQGNKYESMDWRNNIMPTNYLSVNSDLLNSTFTIKIDKDRQITQFNKNDIKDVIFNNPATIVFWKDGTKTVVKCQTDKGDTYNPELGLAMCIIKKMCGNKGNYNDIFNKWLPKED